MQFPFVSNATYPTNQVEINLARAGHQDFGIFIYRLIPGKRSLTWYVAWQSSRMGQTTDPSRSSTFHPLGLGIISITHVQKRVFPAAWLMGTQRSCYATRKLTHGTACSGKSIDTDSVLPTQSNFMNGRSGTHHFEACLPGRFLTYQCHQIQIDLSGHSILQGFKVCMTDRHPHSRCSVQMTVEHS